MNFQIKCKSWKEKEPPRKILVMRFQALGDTIITLPYLQSLKSQYPEVRLYFLTRKEVSEIPKALELFEQVYTIGGGRNAKLQFIISLLFLPRLWWHNYDGVIDLQNNKISRIIRILLFAKAWSQFDKYSNRSAGERTQTTIQAMGLNDIGINPSFKFKKFEPVDQLLRANGWDGKSELIVLNPAGNLPSRNWPINNYIDYARQWQTQSNRQVQFVIMLLNQHRSKSERLKKELDNKCVELSEKTTPLQAFQIINKANFVLSEDSGLMHMAWVQAVPTLALFGSSRKDWSGPQGDLSYCLDASDLDCGPCMLAECIYKDNRCLTRYSPKMVFEMSLQLISKVNK